MVRLRQDVCSFCSETSIKIKNEIDIEKKVDLEDVLLEHKNKSKCFSRMMREKLPNTVQVCFDMMQNQPLPKLSVTDTFYCRQAWIYNLTFVIMSENDQSKDNCYLYTWHEGESGRGPNEIGSALIHFLDILEERYKIESRPSMILNLYSDSCSGQNKNQFIMGLLLHYMNCKDTIFSKIKHIFPVRGHSYMAADQVFGRIEKVLRKKEIIVCPTQYHDIFKQFCQVKNYENDFKVYNIKEACKSIIHPKGFKLTEQKMLLYEKGKKTIGISQNYTDDYLYIKIIKKKHKN